MIRIYSIVHIIITCRIMKWVTQANKFIKNIQCIKKVVLRILWLFTQHMCIVLMLILIDSLILPVLKSEMHEGQHFWCFGSIFHKPVVLLSFEWNPSLANYFTSLEIPEAMIVPKYKIFVWGVTLVMKQFIGINHLSVLLTA